MEMTLEESIQFFEKGIFGTYFQHTVRIVEIRIHYDLVSTIYHSFSDDYVSKEFQQNYKIHLCLIERHVHDDHHGLSNSNIVRLVNVITNSSIKTLQNVAVVLAHVPTELQNARAMRCKLFSPVKGTP